MFVGRDEPEIGEEEFYILSPGLLFVGRDKPKIGKEEFYILSPGAKGNSKWDLHLENLDWFE